MFALLLVALAAVFAREVLRVIPWGLPSWLTPIVVLSVALWMTWPDWKFALSGAGLTGIINAAANHYLTGPGQTVRLNQQSQRRIPPLP